MPRDASGMPLSVARAANAPALTRDLSIFDGELMPIFAVGLGASLLSRNGVANMGTRVHYAAFEDDLGVGVPLEGAVLDDTGFYASEFGQFREQIGIPLNGQPHSSPHVSALFFVCSPSAIVGRVRAVVVYALNAHSVGSFPHVCGESLKPCGVLPLRADRNPTSSVVLIVGDFRVVAALHHVVVGLPQWSSFCAWHGPIIHDFQGE
jgi:hypothetical protein